MASYPRVTVQMAHLYDVLLNDDDQLLRLGVAESLGKCLEDWERAMVRSLRNRGVTWDEIAEALGLTRSAVLYRYAP